MPATANYDIRIPDWEWCIINAKVVGSKAIVQRKPQFEFDMKVLKSKEYFNGFFEESKKRVRKLKKPEDFAALENQKTS